MPVNEPAGPAGNDAQAGSGLHASTTPVMGQDLLAPELEAAALRSRWVDYDTHELLQMISELEDERRWARLREGLWIAVLVHLVVISALTWIPKYVFKVPQVIDPIETLKNRKDLQYLDMPTDALKMLRPKTPVTPKLEKPPTIDKKTLEAMNKATAPGPPKPEPTPQPEAQAQPPLPSQPLPNNPQSPVEAPRPSAVPARPDFAMNRENPADQLREAMKGSQHGNSQGLPNMGGEMTMHPGAGGGVEILSDTQGVDFRNWLQRWHHETEHTWDPLIPDEVNPPILKKGQVMIRFKVLPNGRIMEGSMMLEGRSGDPALDRAAWGALIGSNYPPLPREFHGKYLELRALFMYNMEQ